MKNYNLQLQYFSSMPFIFTLQERKKRREIKRALHNHIPFIHVPIIIFSELFHLNQKREGIGCAWKKRRKKKETYLSIGVRVLARRWSRSPYIQIPEYLDNRIFDLGFSHRWGKKKVIMELKRFGSRNYSCGGVSTWVLLTNRTHRGQN